MTTITFDQSPNPLVNVANKINYKFVEESERDFSFAAAQQMLIAGLHHGPFFRAAVWSPNWQEDGQAGEFPSGFQFTVRAESPVLAGVFSPNAMFAHTMAFPLDAGVSSARTHKTDVKIDDAYLHDSRNRVAERLTEAFTADQLGSLDSNYVGFFSTQRRTQDGYIKKLWCVAQCTSDAAASETMDLIESAAPDDMEQSLLYGVSMDANQWCADPAVVGFSAAPHTTWRQLFAETPQMDELRERQRRHCAKSILRALKHTGLGPVAKSEDSKENLLALLDNDNLVESQRNCVDHVSADGKELAYLSDMISLHATRNSSAIVNEAPRLGPSILHGPWNLDASAAAQAGVVGFPSSVGRIASVRAHNSSPSLNRAEMAMGGAHFWAAEAPLNTNLSRQLYRKRNKQRRSIESALGLANTNAETNLQPVVVILAPTEQPK